MTTTPTARQIGASEVPDHLRLGTAPRVGDAGNPCRSSHPTSDRCGYLIRLTLTPQGWPIENPVTGRVGVDAGWLLGSERFGAALRVRDRLTYLLGGKSHAVIDSAYTCGCRAAG